ncbi:MAG: hydroxymethylbilane synthase [Gammaproteobacteria bacterium]|nr:hydroxymethylbilane synthase [Gammaproteobacteria bacterium]
MKNTLRIATRNSPLAMWQAEFVRTQLQEHHPGLQVDIIGMTTRGDQLLDSPLSKIGGKGLFVKELETAILENRADIAVHSMKDVGVHFPEGLGIACIMKRHNPYDAFVSNAFTTLDELPENAVVGTCSLRRVCQLQKHYPHLQFKSLRGNVNTRLAKLDAGEYDAIILAVSGLERLGMSFRVTSVIDENVCLPAIAQGSLGIECRINDETTKKILSPLADNKNTICAAAERTVNERLNGSCQTPIAAYAVLDDDELYLRALIGEPDGSIMLYAEKTGHISHAREIGLTVADELLAQGAANILAKLQG